MSDMDDVSLPSDDGADQARHESHNRRLAYGTLQVQAEDEPVSASRALSDMRSSAGRYHRLCLQHAELGDSGSSKILQALSESEILTNDNDPSIGAGSTPILSSWHLSALPQWNTFRVVELDSNALSSASLGPICVLLERSPALHTLSLKANELDGEVAGFSALARALGVSRLRRLSLSSNPIGSAALAALLDSIPAAGTTLECLELSNVLPESDTSDSDEELIGAAKAVAGFIADASRCRSLKTLLLNGNGLGSRGVRTIVAALIGSACSPDPASTRSQRQEDGFYDAVFRAQLRRPNRSLEVLELAGNIERGWIARDPEEERERFEAIRKRYRCVPHDEVQPIVAFLDLRARQTRLQAPPVEVPIELARHLATVGVELDEWACDFEEAAELAAGLHAANWQALKQARLERNRGDGQRCRRAAVAILAAARTIGCCARRGPTAPEAAGLEPAGFARFLDLPPELRLLVLRQLDEHGSLSAGQFARVVSFACERSTLGHGEPHFEPRAEAVDVASQTLPAQTWHWSECFAHRAPARDWAADRLDASDSEPLLRSRVIGARTNANAGSAGLYAFLESTSSHRAE